MKILLKNGPEHGRTITADQYCGDFHEVHRTPDGYSYQLTDRRDDRGRRIAVGYPD
ncbi:hypothetical protein [Streptomyces sp. A1136]|uniref:hypothetical protein n=1 Tax=Streptomyces sp. A1136 TaxID=2563102 RepID=UPI0014489665|nr:hypothetical protein [Streptomyces sp. A1136]